MSAWQRRRAGRLVQRLQQWGRRWGLHKVWYGPCLHGRIPWDRCDTCSELTEAEARALCPPEPLTRREALSERGARRRHSVALYFLAEEYGARRVGLRRVKGWAKCDDPGRPPRNRGA